MEKIGAAFDHLHQFAFGKTHLQRPLPGCPKENDRLYQYDQDGQGTENEHYGTVCNIGIKLIHFYSLLLIHSLKTAGLDLCRNQRTVLRSVLGLLHIVPGRLDQLRLFH